jgi:hypothetical protein
VKIAVPDSPLADPLIANAEGVCHRLGWTMVRVPDERCAELLLTGMADMALVTPLGYGQGVGKVDYRIVPGPAVALHDYTNIAGIRFAPDAQEIATVGSHRPSAYFPILGNIVMREKFEAPVVELKSVGDVVDVDCIIDEQAFAGTTSPPTLDLSEEWYDMSESPLPALVWVCRMDADLDTIPTAISQMADPSVTEHFVSETASLTSDASPREGRISYRWNDDLEDAIDAVLHVLYYHQLLTELPAVKILGREDDITDTGEDHGTVH